MNYFLKTDYHNSIILHYFPTASGPRCRRAAVSFNSMESKKGKRKRRKLQGEGQSVRYCAIDQTHPIPTQAWGLIQPPQPTAPPPHRRARSWGDPSEREERKTERQRTFNTHIQHFLHSFHNMKSCAYPVADVQTLLKAKETYIKRLDGMTLIQ